MQGKADRSAHALEQGQLFQKNGTVPSRQSGRYYPRPDRLAGDHIAGCVPHDGLVAQAVRGLGEGSNGQQSKSP